jgi:hypothetical protein
VGDGDAGCEATSGAVKLFEKAEDICTFLLQIENLEISGQDNNGSVLPKAVCACVRECIKCAVCVCVCA